MAIIKAPFNFVPLSDKVFFPEWADKISQDVPFEDGLSGKIEMEITAESPIFVRDGQTENEQSNRFCNINGRYFIPATSVKGEVRNLLEIMSFGKMRVDKNAKFAQREWDNPNMYPIRDPKLQKTICCGWLFEIDGEYCIKKSASSPYRINHKRLDDFFGKAIFREFFFVDPSRSKNNTQKKSKNEYDFNEPWTINGETLDPKTAVFKYKLLESKGIKHTALCNLKFTTDSEYAAKYQENRLRVDKNGGIIGQIVLTGQPSQWRRDRNRQKNDGKFYEFVFDQEIERTIPLTKEEFDHYKFIYKESDDFKYMQKYLKTSGVPVFFRMAKNKLVDFGFALLYKLPYTYSPAELEMTDKRYGKKDRDSDMDMAECIFGKIDCNAVKGRVFFSNFFADENAEEDIPYTLILNSPKASYYPIYIEQDGNAGKTNSYKTYNDGCLSGWKRYVVRKKIWEKKMDNSELDSILIPLKAGTKFRGTISFHNMKPEELGALLSSITFFGDEECYHLLGQAKPYGFGKSKYKITKFEAKPNYDTGNVNVCNIKFLMCQFEKSLKGNGINFATDSSMTELFTIAHEEVDANDLFEYMVMSVDDKNLNEFTEAKKSLEFLQYYSELRHKAYQPNSLLKEMEAQMEQERLEKERKEKEEKERIRILAEQQAQEELKQRKTDRLNAGFSFLLEKKVGCDELKISELSNGVGRISQFLKKNTEYVITENDKNSVEQWLKQIPVPSKKADKKEYATLDSKSWLKIKDIFGESTTKQWFDQLFV